LTVTDNLNTSLKYIKTINTLYNQHTFVVTLSETSASIQQNATHQLIVNCTNDGVAVSSPIVTYTSDNTAISTVDVTTGLVTGVTVGTNNIIVIYMGVTDSIVINITAIPAAPTYKIFVSQGTTDINYINTSSASSGDGATLTPRTFKVFNLDGTAITDGSIFTFSLGDDSKNSSILASQLITKMDNITGLSVRLNTTLRNVKGWFYLIATKNGVETKKELRVKDYQDI